MNRLNFSYFSNISTKNMALFWHISIIDKYIKQSKKIIERQYNKLESSGIFDNMYVYVGIINNIKNNNLEIYNKIKNNPKIKILFEYPEGSECPTSQKLWEWSRKNPNSYVGYIHSKGITRGDKPQVTDWTEFLEYCVILNWKKCIKYLEEGFDTSGCNYNEENPHYVGNFWWAQTNWVSKNVSPDSTPTRHSCGETWITGRAGGAQNFRKGKHKSLHNSNVNHYKTRYRKNNYENSI